MMDTSREGITSESIMASAEYAKLENNLNLIDYIIHLNKDDYTSIAILYCKILDTLSNTKESIDNIIVTQYGIDNINVLMSKSFFLTFLDFGINKGQGGSYNFNANIVDISEISELTALRAKFEDSKSGGTLSRYIWNHINNKLKSQYSGVYNPHSSDITAEEVMQAIEHWGNTQVIADKEEEEEEFELEFEEDELEDEPIIKEDAFDEEEEELEFKEDDFEEEPETKEDDSDSEDETTIEEEETSEEFKLTDKEKEFSESVAAGSVQAAAEICLQRLRWMLQSGYSGVGQNDGILTNCGTIFAHSNGDIATNRHMYKSARQNKNRMMSPDYQDIFINSALLTSLAEQNVNMYTLDKIDKAEPDILSDEMIEEYRQNIDNEFYVNYPFLTRVARGYCVRCKGLRAKMADKNSTHPTNYSELEDWMRDVIRTVGYKLFANIVDEYDGNYFDNNYQSRLSLETNKLVNIFGNGILVVRRNTSEIRTSGKEFDENKAIEQYGLTIRLAISGNHKLDEQVLLDGLKLKTKYTDVIPQSESSEDNEPIERVYVSGDSRPEEGLIQITFTADVDKDDVCIPAADALEGIIASGKRPSWRNALIGERSNGEPLFYKGFASSKNQTIDRVYHIYAGSRAGKGILTSSMLSNIFSDGFKLFYMDGKPDSGIGIGQLAWMNGKEAPIFDGARSGTGEYTPGQLEKYTCKLRTEAESTSFKDSLPTDIFDSGVMTEYTVGLLTYYKSIDLAMKLMQYRSSGGITGEDDWVIFVFDEIQKMYTQREVQTLAAIDAYITLKKYEYQPNVGLAPKTKAEPWNDSLEWVKRFYLWRDSILSGLSAANTDAFGPSCMNIITIFQSTDWISQAVANKTSVIGGLLRLKGSRILGNNATRRNADSSFGNDTTRKNHDWYKWIRPKQWVLIHNDTVDTDKVIKFKPYSLFGYTPENKMDDPHYMVPYMMKLESSFGFNSGDVLQESWNYFDAFVKLLGIDGLKRYMYDPSLLPVKDTRYEKLLNSEKQEAKKTTSEKDVYGSSSSRTTRVQFNANAPKLNPNDVLTWAFTLLATRAQQVSNDENKINEILTNLAQELKNSLKNANEYAELEKAYLEANEYIM